MKRISLSENGGISAPILWLLTIMAGMSVANLYYCQPLLKMIGNDLNCSDLQTNMIAMFTQIGYTLGLLLIVPLGDLWNRKHIIQVNMCLLTVSLFTIFLSGNIHLILIASFFTGIGSVSTQIFVPLIAQCSKPSQKVTNVGIMTSGLLTGVLASRVLSGFIGDYWGWRTMFVIAALLMFISLLLVSCLLPNIYSTFSGKYSELMKSIFRLLVQHPVLAVCTVRAGLIFASFLSFWSCLAFRIAQPPFEQGSDIVGLFGLCGIAGAFAASFAGKLMKRMGVRKLNYAGVTVILAGWSFAYFFQNMYWGIILSIVLIDMGVQTTQVSNQATMLSVDTKSINRINTIFMTANFLGASLGTLASGLAWNSWGWTGVVCTAVAFALASLAITICTKH